MGNGVLPAMAPQPPPSTLGLCVGNDVVDLEHPRLADGSWSSRLEARILAPAEREWLHRGDSPHPPSLRFWSLWAAKETAYKVLCKAVGATPVLEHRAFVSRLQFSRALDDMVEVKGSVRNGPLEVQLTGWGSAGYVHLVGTGRHQGRDEAPEEPPEPLRMEMGVERVAADLLVESFRPDFTEREWEGVHGVPSARARILARTRLRALISPFSGSLEIVTSGDRPGRTPPVVLVDGRPEPELQLSLSHHGRYVAWALLLPPSLSTSAAPEPQNPGR